MKNKSKYEQLVLNMVNFYILFDKEFTGLIPEVAISDITPLLSRMLNEIHLRGRTTSKELSERLNLSVPNTSRGVNKLYHLGYIEKLACKEDKRITYITLSVKGYEIINQFLLQYQEQYFNKLKVLDEKEVDELNEHFEKIKNLFIKMNQKKTNDNSKL